MKVYDLKYNAKAPEGIENRKAYIIGGGIAGLSAAVHLVDDIHMPGKNITVLESLSEIGGSMDGTGNAQTGYLCRGERELEPNMECLWNICSKVPSLRHPGRTILDDVWDYNYEHPLHNEYRLVVKGKAIDDEVRSGLSAIRMFDPVTTVPADIRHPIILEVKYDAYFPDIIRDAVQLDDRRTTSFSKYAACRLTNY